MHGLPLTIHPALPIRKVYPKGFAPCRRPPRPTGKERDSIAFVGVDAAAAVAAAAAAAAAVDVVLLLLNILLS